MAMRGAINPWKHAERESWWQTALHRTFCGCPTLWALSEADAEGASLVSLQEATCFALPGA
eukprot:CAMPEP_0117601068 /NCGR_PEP_ID=MMETSP0784-20121206/76832_1 /TAXON_ID=39447 /ORGANISM="" /LENGTH=60 /DNA_ID=CAMNT_0005403759 /DNA_START=728 /DNA_END=907 /DNA_ORIENTATION=+